MIEYTPALQAEFTNKILSDFANGLDQVLKSRLSSISPKVPHSTIQNLRYEIMEANASDISARYGLYFQDSGRHSEMRKLSGGKPLPIDVIMDWIRRGRENLFSKTPGYQQKSEGLSRAKKTERVATAIAFSKAKGTIRRGKGLKERQWLNRYFYGWYGRLVEDFILKQTEFLQGSISKGFEPFGDIKA